MYIYITLTLPSSNVVFNPPVAAIGNHYVYMYVYRYHYVYMYVYIYTYIYKDMYIYITLTLPSSNVVFNPPVAAIGNHYVYVCI
jgi:hypothetical protein